jgi:hypothetical protein
MIYRDFLKDLEGQILSHFPATSGGVHILANESSLIGTKCTLLRVEEDFIVLEFVKTSIFNSSKMLYIPISMVYCDFADEKK